MRTDCGSSNSRIIGLFTLATLLVSTAARPAEHSGDLSAEQDLRSRLRPFAQILADVRDRPSRVIYTEYPVSAQHGLVRGFVHVTDGTVVLARTDLVVNASLPIVIRRAYHSARSQSREFGATGWRLTLAEFIEPRRGGRFIYTYGNGATLELDSSGRIESALQAYLTDVDDIHLLSENAFQVRTRTGLSKLFRRSAGRFLLSSVTDPYGNRLDFRYQASALVRVEGSSGAWAEFEYAPHGQLKSVADSHGRSVAYEYDAAGRLAAVVDTAAQRWTFAYDSENRLRSSATPNGIVDMEFQYDARGRALSSRANGARHAFSYQKYRTAVTDPRGLTTTFAAASSGLTTEVVNALGTRTALRLARSGVPTALVRNGELAVELSTERSSGHDRPSRARVVTADGRSYLVRYDQHRRVAQVLAADGSRGFEVEQYGPGLIPQAIVHVDGTREEAQYDERGELSRLVGRDGKALSFQRTDDRWRIEDASRHHVEFQFDALGRLRSADIGKDQVLSFFYNDVGLRERTEASVGWYIRYQYDASGSLFYSSGGFKEQAGPAYNYVLRADRRLEAITDSDGDDHHFVYDAQGRLAEMRTPEAVEARFAYDELSRLKRVEHREPQDAEALAALEYDYAPDEPDIAAQLSRRTLPLFNQQQEITDFASRFDIVLTRSKPAALGLLTYDDLTDELTLAAEPSRWNPLSYVQQSVAALRLEALLEGPQGVNTFILPSNRLFVPPEYWSVNCCMCPCDPNDPNCPPYSECEGCLPPLPPGPQTTIKYSTFIPLDHVRLSPPVSDWFYEADNTGSYIPGHFRVEQTVTVRTGSATIEGYSAQSAVSRLFQQSATNLTTAGTCFRKSCPNCAAYPGFGTPITFEGQCLVRSASDQGSSLADNMDSVRADVIEAGNATAFVNYIVVRLRGSPVIGVSPNFLIGAGSPHIDWDVTVQISYDWTTGQTTYFVLGQHDGFPFHEIQIKGTHVYGRDPIVNGNTPFSLFDPLDVNVSLQGSVP